MNIMMSNTLSETISNMTESVSSSAQILIQMQTHIKQLEKWCQQQNLKISKSDQFNRTKKKLRQWLTQMNVHMNAQFYQLDTERDKIMLAINYLTDKVANWIQLYINWKFYSKDKKDKKDEMFSNYNKFVNKIMTAFRSMNFKKKTEYKLEHFRQKKAMSIYAANFRQIVSVLDWNDKIYVSLFYHRLKNKVKNELAKIEWSDDLNKMIKITVQIDNWLWEKQQKKKKRNSWKNQHDQNQDKKKNHEQLMNWKYINNWKIKIFKQKCQKKELCFHCEKKNIRLKNAELYNIKHRNQQKHKHE